MSFSSDDSVKERIREAIDIVELVSQYVPLRRSGRNYVARCPWHDDSRPSLQINPVRQTFKCWVCDIGGDVFSFVMKIENVGFKEAMEILADKAGIQLPKKPEKKIYIDTGSKTTSSMTGSASIDPNTELAVLGNEDGENDGDTRQTATSVQRKEISKQSLFKAADWVARLYHEALLRSDEADIARKYLKDRGIDEADIVKFQIGYAPLEFDWLVDRVKRNPERLKILELIGNLLERSPGAENRIRDTNNQNENKIPRYFDRFRGRVLFPIRDTQDKTVAFGGRLIPGSPLNSPAKYLNSPETPLFSKHRMLYGLDIARHRMKETRRALIMEGYTDVIVAHRFGFGDAVAVLGTALGTEHIRVLKRYADKMILVLDGDEAGRKRADQVLELFVAQGVDMSVLTLPAGADPADFLQEHGNEAFELLLQTETVDVLKHAFMTATRGIDLKNDIIGSGKALDSLLEVIAKVPTKGTVPSDPLRIRVDKTIESLSHRFLIEEEKIRKRLKSIGQRTENRPQFPRHEEQADKEKYSDEKEEIWFEPEALPDRLEREMLELWLADPTVIYEFWEPVPIERCRSPIVRLIYEKCNALIEANKTATFDRLLVAFDDPKMKSFLVELDESGREKRNVKTPPLITGGDEKTQPAFRDEMSDWEESLRNEIEEETLSPEWRARLIREIIEGFDLRDAERNRMKDVNQLRDASLTEKERLDKLLQMQQRLIRRQEEKRKRMESE